MIMWTVRVTARPGLAPGLLPATSRTAFKLAERTMIFVSHQIS
jgi:hypothetical protein